MKKDIYLEIALCLASSISIGAVTSLIRERKVNKKNMIEKDREIDDLKKDINDLNFVVANLIKEQREIKDVILKQDRLIEILKEHFNIPDSESKKTDKGNIYLFKK